MGIKGGGDSSRGTQGWNWSFMCSGGGGALGGALYCMDRGVLLGIDFGIGVGVVRSLIPRISCRTKTFSIMYLFWKP
jgi:hypothetical protein